MGYFSHCQKLEFLLNRKIMYMDVLPKCISMLVSCACRNQKRALDSLELE